MNAIVMELPLRCKELWKGPKGSSFGVRIMELDRKLKTALDEARLLILGAQVLFGFQSQSVFQELFAEVPRASQLVQCSSLLLLLSAICCLIAPSMHHQIVYGGESRQGALRDATRFAGISLLPLTLGLGASAFVIFEHLFGRGIGIVTGILFTVVALSLLYAIGFLLRMGRGAVQMPAEHKETPLKTRVQQLLTEARVIIPGAQALLGFQFIVTLTKSFAELPPSAKYLHAGGLCAVALAIILLMTPAAIHRIAFQGEDDEAFFRIGSWLVIVAVGPLAPGISSDVYVVFFKTTENPAAALVAALLSLFVLLGLWYAIPLWLRWVAQCEGLTFRRRMARVGRSVSRLVIQTCRAGPDITQE
jgi:hypothetical protein